MFVKQTGILLLLSLTFLKIPPSLAAQNLNQAKSQKAIKTGTNRTEIRDHKIVGGFRCPISTVPFLVSLRFLNSREHFCGGSLLSEYWILTALHCLETRCHRNIEVIAGSSYAKDPRKNLDNEAIQYSTIAQCYFYPIVDDRQFDIAIARLRKPFEQSDNVGYVLLPFDLPTGQDRNLIDICSNATIAGWGTQYANSIYEEPIVYPVPDYDPHLLCAHLPVISTEECNIRSHTSIFSTFFCTYQNMTDACFGDSGGPLLCNGYQYGIVSYGFGCAFYEFPGVYTNILYFKNFILTTMESPFKIYKSFANAIRVNTKLNIILVILVSELYIYLL